MFGGGKEKSVNAKTQRRKDAKNITTENTEDAEKKFSQIKMNNFFSLRLCVFASLRLCVNAFIFR